MSKFTEAELAYLKSQHLGRLATVNQRGEPENKPVGFRYNPELDTIDIGGPNHSQSQKYRNVAGNGLVSFVVDDALPTGEGRGIEIRGKAEVFPEGGKEIYSWFSPEIIRLTPKRIITWDLTGKVLPVARRTIE
ncbi:PPOX class F420-dependent oxidoreductase [Ktedonosporobacter rubrisoli]|uniref:PPOX class F420-dependent oxidoreductase n=1 Tax=Ktedonosporobacter rubrisoli TaxID=2509675 RepID=A0A4P6JUJ6_KTERU|nr:PPOX class F420-dependent oxidoreductase [Ktedonosporobacter rubrisoli]QBD78980.1 PPOX class F420-dependent oxidoreductase [Ktedonosporobacter rubrisoli]